MKVEETIMNLREDTRKAQEPTLKTTKRHKKNEKSRSKKKIGSTKTIAIPKYMKKDYKQANLINI